MSAFFPMFVDLSGARCIVIGAGAVGRRKAAALESFGAEVDLLDSAEGVDFSRYRLAITATADAATNHAVADACRRASVPVNVVDDASSSDFVFGAIARKGSVTAAVSTGGKSPVAAQWLRDRIAPLLTDVFANAVERLGKPH